jgi:hypothetical protein
MLAPGVVKGVEVRLPDRLVVLKPGSAVKGDAE